MDPENSQTAATSSPARVTVRDVHGSVRALFTLAGMCGLVAGGVAVFRSTNQAGTVALLAVGAIASLLAVVGKVPLRWVIGGHEFDMSEQVAAAQEVAEAVAARLDPAGTAELAGRLAAGEATRGSATTAAMLEYVAFEQAAISRAIDAVTAQGWGYTTDASHRDYDGLVSIPGSPTVPVEYHLIRNAEAGRRSLVVFGERQARKPYGDCVLVVSSLFNGAGVARIVRDLQGLGVDVVALDDPAFEGRFLAACRHVAERLQNATSAANTV